MAAAEERTYKVIKEPEPPHHTFYPKLLKDFYRPMMKEDILKAWESDVGFDKRKAPVPEKFRVSREDFLQARDTVLKAMSDRDIFPSEWTHQRESAAGLYPNISDPDFAAKLFSKTEFSDLRSGISPDDICESKEREGFETTPVQRLVARFLHPETPYRSTLLVHGVGVGKSCSAITVAETFLENMPQNQVFILCPQAIASGFKRTIFDSERVIPLSKKEAKQRGELWQSSQCTGTTYLKLTGTMNEPNKSVIEGSVEYIVRKRYRIMGYLAFANWILKKFEKMIPKTYVGEARRDAENKIIHSLFSDHLIIVDEAHNLRDIEGASSAPTVVPVKDVMEDEAPVQGAATDAAEGKRLTPVLRRILKTAEGLRLMMMTATPMYNTAPEILFLLNMLIMNDTKDETKMLHQNDFFNRDGTLLQIPKESDFEKKQDYERARASAVNAHATLGKICSHYISYMRGENPASFPLRLTPPEAAGTSLFDDYPMKSLSRAEKRVKLTTEIKDIMSMLPLVIHRPDLDTHVGGFLYKLLKDQRLVKGNNEEEDEESTEKKRAAAEPRAYKISDCADKSNNKFPFTNKEIADVLKSHKQSTKGSRGDLCNRLTDELVLEMQRTKRGAVATPEDRCGKKSNKKFPYSNNQIADVLKKHGLKHRGSRSELCALLTDELINELKAKYPQAGGADDEGSEVTDFVLDQAMQAANITYHWRGISGSRGWDYHWKETPGRIKQFVWNAEYDEEDNYTMTVDDVFGSAKLHTHAPKIAAIVKSVTSAKGMSFIFSRYVKAGALPIAIALERAGWTRVLSDGSPSPIIRPDTVPPVPRQCAFCTNKEGQSHEGHSFSPANFVLLTGDDGLSPDFRGTLRYANTLRGEFETAGGKVKAILGSQIASEGLDLKCIRENHLLDGWYHLNRIEQVEGRAVRYCSHAALKDKAYHNCLIYLHVVSIPEFETADLYAYRLAARKSIPIGQVQRIIKISAWDCLINKDAVLLKGLLPRLVVDAQGRKHKDFDPTDKPYTSICDYQDRCEYICAASKIKPYDPDISTYEARDAQKRFIEKQKILQNIFSEEISYPVHFIKNTVYSDMPWEIGSIGLRNILNNPKFIIQRSDGIRGTLTLKNGYIVFHPVVVTDPHIPMALRYGRAFGRIPRFMDMPRGTLLATKVPDAVPHAEQQTDISNAGNTTSEEVVGVAETDLMQAVAEWKIIYDSLIEQTLATKLAPPSGVPTLFFEGWRFVFNRFGKLTETRDIAMRWWTDVEWSQDQKINIFKKWLAGNQTEEEKYLESLFVPTEFFRGELSGFYGIDLKKNAIVTYCFFEGDDSPAVCPSNMLEDVVQITGKPVNRVNNTGPIFGLLNLNPKQSGAILFKSVSKEDGSPEGAQCQNNSNLTSGRARIKNIHDQIRKSVRENDPIVDILLDDRAETIPSDAERKTRRATMNIQHLYDLSKNELCPYMEFLLRWMDTVRLANKRWFLTLVESGRSGLKLG
jgi:hypothetical protein